MRRVARITILVLCVAGGGVSPEAWAREGTATLVEPSSTGAMAHHRTASPGFDEGTRYSIFMHDTAGVFLVAIGLLAFLGGFEHRGLSWVRSFWPFLWIALGVFLFIRSDPEAWPIGPAGFWESFTLPTAHEVIQHKALSLVVVLIGMFELLMKRGTLTHSAWAYVMPALWMGAALALLLHRHLDHPQLDLANMQHVSWGIQSLMLATIRLLEDTKVLRWNHKAGLWTIVLAVLGLQIAIYTE